MHSEDYARNTQMQIRTNFPKLGFQLPYQWHSQRPSKLNRLDIFTNQFPVLSVKFLEPIAHWLNTHSRREENYTQFGTFIHQCKCTIFGTYRQVSSFAA
jgi:hypothetical protein